MATFLGGGGMLPGILLWEEGEEETNPPPIPAVDNLDVTSITGNSASVRGGEKTKDYFSQFRTHFHFPAFSLPIHYCDKK